MNEATFELITTALPQPSAGGGRSMRVRQRRPELARREAPPDLYLDPTAWPMAYPEDLGIGLCRLPSRAAVAAAIEALITLLDEMDPDPDGGDGHPSTDDDCCLAGDDDLVSSQPLVNDTRQDIRPGDPEDAEENWDQELDLCDAEADHDNEPDAPEGPWGAV